MLIKKTQRIYDRFGAKGTTTKYYHRDDADNGDTFNGNSKALLVAPILIAILITLTLIH